MSGSSRYGNAVEREAEKAEGLDPPHPADQYSDPAAAVLAEQPDQSKRPKLRHLGGSDDDAFNIALAEATRQTAWITRAEDRDKSLTFVGKALAGIAPRDEMEGMLGAQMVSMHLASLECMRRAMITEQPSDLRAMNLKQGAKCSQTYATLLDALDRHRGRGQQKITVEHLHVSAGPVAYVDGGRGAG